MDQTGTDASSADGEIGNAEEQGTKRFRAKRDAILSAAAEAINE